MVKAVELAGVLDTHHIAYVFHHAYQRGISARRSADRAEVGFAYVMAYTAVSDSGAEIYDGLPEGHCFILRAPEQMQCEAHGSLASYSRQAR